MEWATTTLALYGMGGAALATSLMTLRRRLRAVAAPSTPPSTGHARMARRLAALVPFYEYDEAQFFNSDGAPADIAARRRAGFERLSALYATRFAETIRCSAEVADGISDLQFTDAYRVPFQYSRYRARAPAVRPPSSSRRDGVTVTDLDGNRFYDLTGSYGVNVFGYDFYKEAIERGAERVRALGPVLGAYHPVIAENVATPEGDFRPRRSLVPHVRHRGRHAGGAACALSHAPLAPGALLRCLSWLVGRRAAGHRQPAAGARDLHAARHVRGFAARAAHAARHRLRAGQSAAGAASERRRAGDSALVDSARRAHFDKEAYARLAQAAARRLHRARTSC